MAPQIVLMTGSSSGIWLAMAQRLARDPDHQFIVIATVIAMSEKNDLEAAVKDYIDKTVFIKELDITKDENITEVVEEVISSHGHIDVLINIAGIALPAIPERVSREQIDKIFNVNVIGTIRLTQAVLPHMKEKQSGKIITFSSVTGKIGFAYSEFYCASKFALEGFFESLAAGLRAFKIRVCLIEPAQVESALWDWILHQMDSVANDETLTEIDRRQNRITHARSKEGTRISADDVVEAVITRCLDVDEPVLRHLLAAGQTGDVLQKTLSDLTGEEGISAFGF